MWERRPFRYGSVECRIRNSAWFCEKMTVFLVIVVEGVRFQQNTFAAETAMKLNSVGIPRSGEYFQSWFIVINRLKNTNGVLELSETYRKIF